MKPILQQIDDIVLTVPEDERAAYKQELVALAAAWARGDVYARSALEAEGVVFGATPGSIPTPVPAQAGSGAPGTEGSPYLGPPSAPPTGGTPPGGIYDGMPGYIEGSVWRAAGNHFSLVVSDGWGGVRIIDKAYPGQPKTTKQEQLEDVKRRYPDLQWTPGDEALFILNGRMPTAKTRYAAPDTSELEPGPVEGTWYITDPATGRRSLMQWNSSTGRFQLTGQGTVHTDGDGAPGGGITSYQSGSLDLQRRRVELDELKFAASMSGELSPLDEARIRQMERQLEIDQARLDLEAEIQRGRLRIDEAVAARQELEARIKAARTGEPLTYLGLLRGQVPGEGPTGEIYKGVRRIVPAIEGIRGTPGLTAGTSITPTGGAMNTEEMLKGLIAAGWNDPSAEAYRQGGPRPPDAEIIAKWNSMPHPGVAPGGDYLARSRGATSVSTATSFDVPEQPPGMAAIAEGRPLAPFGLPPGIRPAGLQQQANESPYERAARMEKYEFQGVPSMDVEAYEKRLREKAGRGFGGATSVPSPIGVR